MSLKVFEDLVLDYVALMDPATRPSEHAIRKALTWCANVELPTWRAGQQAVRQCVRLAMDFDEMYQQGRKDAVQDTATSTGSRVVLTTLESTINALMAQSRQQACETGTVSYSTDVQPQSLIESLSTGDTLLSHFQDVASLAGTTVTAVATAWTTGQPLYLSDVDARTMPYSITMLGRESEVVQRIGFFPLTGDLSVHRVQSLAPAMRHASGNKPRQHVRSVDEQKKKYVERDFLDEQKQQRGWTPERGWPNGKAPKGFWPTTERAWREQYQQQWGAKTSGALRKDDERLPRSMPHGANT